MVNDPPLALPTCALTVGQVAERPSDEEVRGAEAQATDESEAGVRGASPVSLAAVATR